MQYPTKSRSKFGFFNIFTDHHTSFTQCPSTAYYNSNAAKILIRLIDIEQKEIAKQH